MTSLESLISGSFKRVWSHATGKGDHAIEIEHVLPLAPMLEVTERYHVGSVSLVGNTARRLSLTRAFGLNSGLQHLNTFARTIAALEQGWASNESLGSYYTKPHMVVVIRSAQNGKNAGRMSDDADDAGALQRRPRGHLGPSRYPESGCRPARALRQHRIGEALTGGSE